MNLKQLTFLERITVQRYLTDLWDHLCRQRAYFEDQLRRIPGDIVAMGAVKRIEIDLQTMEPLVLDLQKESLLELEGILGKPFHYLIENKPIDLLKKVK